MKPLFPSRFNILILLGFASPSVVFAAACCGGGFAAPAIIVGDDRAMLTSAYSEITDEVGPDSLWEKRTSKESTEVFKIESAHIFSDRWQAGASVPMVRRSRNGAQSSGIGDIAGTLGYEYLPDWDYNPWRPKGVGYLQVTLPSGKSIQEADTLYQLDSRGRGFFALGIGTMLTKTFTHWDVFSQIDAHRSFSKKYANAQSSGTLNPGYGGSVGAGAGYHLKDERLGAALTWTHEDPIDVVGTIKSDGASQNVVTAAATITHLFPGEWSATASYTDQTLFGNPVNTNLEKGLLLSLQKRWLR